MDAVHSMIEAAYHAAVEPDQFSDFVEAWDDYCERTGHAPNFNLLSRHFDQALALTRDTAFEQQFNLVAILDLIAAPAILTDTKGRYVMGNAQGQALLSDFALGASLAGRFKGNWRPADDRDKQNFQFEKSEDEFLIASSRTVSLPDGDKRILIRFAASGWTEHLTNALQEHYELTKAEVDVAQLVYTGMTTQEIAANRDRSTETVRSQVKSILLKTGTRNRSGFVQFVSHLHYVAAATVSEHAEETTASRSDFRWQKVVTAQGQAVVVTRYGVTDGLPVLYFTTSSKPEETPEWRRAVAEVGLHIIAIHRPGFGGSDAAGSWMDTSEFLADFCPSYLDLDSLQPLLIAGHREGGILAAEVASKLKRSHKVLGVVLLSTGVPDPEKLSPNMKRNSHVIQTVPSALRLGYRAARRVFQTGRLGQNQIVQFFFKDSPRDRAVIEDPAFWTIIRDNIEYCFQNPDMIVDDVAKWISDWSEPIQQSGDQPPWHFILGDKHDFMPASNVAGFCSQNPKCTVDVFENEAQMLLYTHALQVAQKVRDFADRELKSR